MVVGGERSGEERVCERRDAGGTGLKKRRGKKQDNGRLDASWKDLAELFYAFTFVYGLPRRCSNMVVNVSQGGGGERGEGGRRRLTQDREK